MRVKGHTLVSFAPGKEISQQIHYTGSLKMGNAKIGEGKGSNRGFRNGIGESSNEKNTIAQGRDT